MKRWPKVPKCRIDRYVIVYGVGDFALRHRLFGIVNVCGESICRARQMIATARRFNQKLNPVRIVRRLRSLELIAEPSAHDAGRRFGLRPYSCYWLTVYDLEATPIITAN
jgi:hypothetical protein